MKIRLSETRNSKRVVEKSRDEWVNVWSDNHKGSTKTLEKNIEYVGTTDDIKKTFGVDELASNGVVRFGLYLASDKTVNHDTGKKIKSRDEWSELNKTMPDKYLAQIRLYGFYDKLPECVENGIVNNVTIGKVLDAMWMSNNYDGVCECEDAKRNRGSKQFGNYACKHVIFLGDLNKHTKTYNNVKKDLVKIICEILKTSRKFKAFCADHGFEIKFDGSAKEAKNENINKYRNNVMEDYEDIIVDIDEDFENEVEDDAIEYVDDANDVTQGESTFDTNALYLDCNTILDAIQNDTALSCHGVQVTDIIDRIDRVNEGEIVDIIDRKFIDMLLEAIKSDMVEDTDETVEQYTDEYDDITFDTDEKESTFDVDDAEIEYESRCGVRRKENGRQCRRYGECDDFDIINEFDNPYDDYDDVYSDDYFDNDGDDFANDYVGRSTSDYRDDGYSDDYSYRPIRRSRNQW